MPALHAFPGHGYGCSPDTKQIICFFRAVKEQTHIAIDNIVVEPLLSFQRLKIGALCNRAKIKTKLSTSSPKKHVDYAVCNRA